MKNSVHPVTNVVYRLLEEPAADHRPLFGSPRPLPAARTYAAKRSICLIESDADAVCDTEFWQLAATIKTHCRYIAVVKVQGGIVTRVLKWGENTQGRS